METPFRAMDFIDDRPITKDDLDQMQSNLQWLTDNTPRGRFVRNNNTVQEDSLVVLGGSSYIAPRPTENHALAKVRFSTAFDSDCQPSVTTGVVCNWKNKVHCVVAGPGEVNYPNSSGFDLRVKIQASTPQQEYIINPIYVHWIAMGFRDLSVNEF